MLIFSLKNDSSVLYFIFFYIFFTGKFATWLKVEVKAVSFSFFLNFAERKCNIYAILTPKMVILACFKLIT